MAISLPLSSVWIWYYILDQYDTDLFQSYVGYVISAITFSLGVCVMRYAPGGEGPMDLYMVVSLVYLRSLNVSQYVFSTHLQLPSFVRTLDSPYTLWLCSICNMARFHCGQACRTIGIIRCVAKDTKYCVGSHSPCIWQLYTRPRGQCHIVKTRLVNHGNDSMLCRTHLQPLYRTRSWFLGINEIYWQR